MTCRRSTSCAKGLFTNTPQAGPYRGAGRPEAAYFTERLVEHAAKQIGMDVAEIRRVNLISPDKFPYNTPTWYSYDSGEFVRLLDKCIDMADWNGYAKRKKASEKAGKLRGRSVCYYIEFGGIFNDRMDIRFDPVDRHGVRRHALTRAGARDSVRATCP